jgi:type VI secretion system protein ImpC
MNRDRGPKATARRDSGRPKVNLTYEIESNGAIVERSLPFVVGVLANFSGTRVGAKSFKDRRFHAVDFDSFSGVLVDMRPSVEIEIAEGSVFRLEFEALRDFTPQALIARVPVLSQLWSIRADILTCKEPDIQLVHERLSGLACGVPIAAGSDKSAAALVEQIDGLLSGLIEAILHHPDFRALEATWQGLWYLVVQTQTGKDLKIEILDISKRELFKDLDKAVEFDQSQIFKKVYENRFGSPGNDPFGVLIGDYSFTNHPEDLDLLGVLSNVAAAAFVPFVAAASAQMFGCDSFAESLMPRDMEKLFESVEFIRWRSFRESEDARWVALTLPEILLRTPYTYRSEGPKPYVFSENTQGVTYLLWGNAAFALATCMTRAFVEEHWLANIQGWNGGRVTTLPVAKVPGDDDAKYCVSALISDRRHSQFSNLGFAAFVQMRNADEAIFFAVPSCQKPKIYDREDATGMARLYSQIRIVMVCARFAQYLKIIARDLIGSYKERADYEQRLGGWLEKYVSHIPVESDEELARYPLREGRVSVQDVPGRPGAYDAILFLRPQYGVEGLTLSFRFVVRLPLLGG